MRVLVWQWGRRGAGPRYAAAMAAAIDSLPGHSACLSLSRQAEILRGPDAPRCDLPFATYESLAGFAMRLPAALFEVAPLAARIRALRPDIAICAMPAALDLLMAAALQRVRVPFLVVVHDADAHPGDGLPFQMALQRGLARRSNGLVALTAHVADRLQQQGMAQGGAAQTLIRSVLPPFVFGPPPPPPRAHGGPLRLLSFGRLLPYKGLDLLGEALALVGPRPDLEVRVVGSGPDSPALAALRRLPGVRVENRWVPENEVGTLLAWSDALVLSHREASQSGAAAAAVAARRWVVATRVGGMAEQLSGEPLARLCEPDAESLAAALRRLLDDAPPEGHSVADPNAVWRHTAEALTADFGRVIQPIPDRMAVPAAVAAG